jgi:hypothetical protein
VAQVLLQRVERNIRGRGLDSEAVPFAFDPGGPYDGSDMPPGGGVARPWPKANSPAPVAALLRGADIMHQIQRVN